MSCAVGDFAKTSRPAFFFREMWFIDCFSKERKHCYYLSLPGVDFTLPLASGAQPKAEGTSNSILEDSENEDESAASTWLCSLGIATQDFPAANMQQITLYPPNN